MFSVSYVFYPTEPECEKLRTENDHRISDLRGWDVAQW
jgi:hypothetical protein